MTDFHSGTSKLIHLSDGGLLEMTMSLCMNEMFLHSQSQEAICDYVCIIAYMCILCVCVHVCVHICIFPLHTFVYLHIKNSK